jgi:hypothetical protein
MQCAVLSCIAKTLPPEAYHGRMDQCAFCRTLEEARNDAERLWTVARAELIAGVANTNASDYNRRSALEITARMEVDASRIELEQHQRVHSGAN